MIILHQYPAVYGISSLSPFCIKVEIYLKLCGLPYKIVTERNPGRGPKGKMPFIEDGDVRVGDSSLIISYLKEKYGDPLDKDLTPSQRSMGVAIQRLCEDHLYWVLLYARWGDADGFLATQKAFSPMFPIGTGAYILHIIRRRLVKQGRAHGLLRHSRAEIYQFGFDDLNAITHLLRDAAKFLFGKNPSTYDVVVYTFLLVILNEPTQTPLRSQAASSIEIHRYTQHMADLLRVASS